MEKKKKKSLAKACNIVRYNNAFYRNARLTTYRSKYKMKIPIDEERKEG